MHTLEINVPDNKIEYVKNILKKAGVSVIEKKEKYFPNEETQSAMKELKTGNGKKFSSVEALFNSI